MGDSEVFINSLILDDISVYRKIIPGSSLQRGNSFLFDFLFEYRLTLDPIAKFLMMVIECFFLNWEGGTRDEIMIGKQECGR